MEQDTREQLAAAETERDRLRDELDIIRVHIDRAWTLALTKVEDPMTLLQDLTPVVAGSPPTVPGAITDPREARTELAELAGDEPGRVSG